MKFARSLLTLTLASAALAACQGNPTPGTTGAAASPILRGVPATLAQLYGTVSLNSPSDGPFCTGTLIAPTVVVTAGHCVTDTWSSRPIATSEVFIVAGVLDAQTAPSGNRFPVRKLLAHPDFGDLVSDEPNTTGLGRYGDIAILLLSRAIPSTVLNPVPILPMAQFDANLTKGKLVTISGYGTRDKNGMGDYGQLYIADTPYERRSDTEFLVGTKAATTGSTPLPDTCPGDSGGPAYLVVDGTRYLIGATSRGMPMSTVACGDGGVDTLVSAYEDWLKAKSDGEYFGSAPVALGKACALDVGCESGHCVDGVCCNTTCGGGLRTDCQACSVAAGAAVDGTCGVASATTVCRTSAGACDLPELCDGSSLACRSDAVAASGTSCRAVAGPCDVEERCDGTAAACPNDAFAAATVQCRSVAGPCDVEERCTGTAATCPNDALRPKNTVCFPDAASCRFPGLCDGALSSCTTYGPMPDGAYCGSGKVCTAGACVTGVAPAPDAGGGCSVPARPASKPTALAGAALLGLLAALRRRKR